MKNIKWQKTKKIGKFKFSILYGLFFSLIASSLFILFIEFGTQKEISLDHFFIIGILIILGPIWALSYWNGMNKKYNKPF